MSQPAPMRHSLRDINEALRRMAQQRSDGALSPDEYRSSVSRLVDGLAHPRVLAALVDDADTETRSVAEAAGAPQRARSKRPPQRVRRQVVGWMALVGVVLGMALTVAALFAGGL